MSDGRQTAFPGIWVESLEVSGKAPEATPGTMRNVVDRGVTRNFDFLKRGADFAGETVGEFMRSAEEMVGPFVDEFTLTYNLKVKALPEAPLQFSQVQERSVAVRARAFVRAKNPTELEVINVGQPVKDERLSDGGLDAYDVSVTVTK